MGNIRVIKETGEVIIFNGDDYTSIPTLGGSAIVKTDDNDITVSNWNFKGFTKKNYGQESYLKGKRIYERNSRGKIKDLYVDELKELYLVSDE